MSKDAAAARWKAVEAFNTIRYLSAAARRVGIALVTTMDAKTLACFPSEPRLAATLGLSMSAVQKAKNELRRRGFIDWSNHGRPQSGAKNICHYTFNWGRLNVEAEAKKEMGRDQVLAGGEPEPNSAHLDVSKDVTGYGVSNHVSEYGVRADEEPKPRTFEAKPRNSGCSNPVTQYVGTLPRTHPADTPQHLASHDAALEGASCSSSLQENPREPLGASEPVERPKALEEDKPKRPANPPRPKRRTRTAIALIQERDASLMEPWTVNGSTIDEEAVAVLLDEGDDAGAWKAIEAVVARGAAT